MNHCIDNSSKDQNALDPYFNRWADNAMRLCKLANSSERKQSINGLDAINAILTRKFVPEGQASTDQTVKV